MDEDLKYADLVARLQEIGLTEDCELLAETTQLFLHDAAQMVESMKSAVSNDDTSNLGRAAHRLKGAALNLGAAQVAAAAKRIEDDVRRGAPADVTGALTTIERELSGVGKYLRSMAKAGVKV